VLLANFRFRFPPGGDFPNALASEKIEGPTLHSAAAASSRKLPESFVSKLAQFFPNATPVRIPVNLTRVNLGGGQFSESTVIEFGTYKEVLFSSALPLEFADKLRIQNPDGTLDIDVSVVAVQYDCGKTAVAARFLKDVPNWIVKP
jgi:hypothetical protein